MTNPFEFKDKSARDPVRGRLLLTPIEQLFIDRPEFHRLHFVSQQSVAYLTFPSNRTSRFAHSLGATQIAGDLFKKCVENTPNDILQVVLSDAEGLVLRYAKILAESKNEGLTESGRNRGKYNPDTLKSMAQESLTKMLGQPLGFNHRPLGYQTTLFTNLPHEKDREYRFYLNLIWQSIRVATLLHDIGHLPLSHLFEEAINSCIGGREGIKCEHLAKSSEELFRDFDNACYRRLGYRIPRRPEEKAQFHEMIGVLIDTGFPQWPENDEIAYKFVLYIAQSILASASPTGLNTVKSIDKKPIQVLPYQRLLSVLHTIVSGEVDADRLDYCIRDPFSAGIESAGVDAEQIVASASFAAVPQKPKESDTILESPDDNSRLVVAFDSGALDSLEGFYFSRYHSFRRVASDHNSARFYAIAKQAIVSILEIIEIEHAKPDINRDCEAWHRVVAQLKIDGWINESSLGFPFIDPTRILKFDDAWFRTTVGNLLECIHNGIDESVRDAGINKNGFGRAAGDEPDFSNDPKILSYVCKLLQSYPSQITSLYLCASALHNRRLDQIYSAFKHGSAAQSLRDAAVIMAESGELQKYLNRPPTKKEMRRAVTLIESYTIALRAPDKKNYLRKYLSEHLGQILQDDSQVDASIPFVCLVHSTGDKLPRRADPPRLWLRHHDLASAQSTLHAASSWSSLLSRFETIAGGPYLRLTIVGMGLRSRLGRMSAPTRTAIRDVVLEAIWSAVCKDCAARAGKCPES